MKKVRILAILILCTVMIAVAFKVKDRYENKIWYEFTEEIKKEYALIKSVDKNDYGPHTTLWIYLKEDRVEIERVEKILGVILNKLNNDEFLNYIQKYHDKHASGKFSFIDIRFKYKNDKSDIMYEFESVGEERPYYSRFNLWRGIDESVIGRKYELSDYK